ncbi:MAG: methyl-accepting chemotaxis protein [Clostridia bacterium]|nr:methyl-accepting chemotaxis protein [Clostridia bacterium]
MDKEKTMSIGFKFSLMVVIMIILSMSINGVIGFVNYQNNVTESKYILNTITNILISSTVLFVILIYFIRKQIIIPLKILINVSNKLTAGDTDVNIVQKTNDEIGQLMDSYARMVDNVIEQSKNAQKIAEGDLSIKINPKSEKDILSNSLQIVVDNLNELNSEVDTMLESIMDGNLLVRGNSNNLKGKYKGIIEGVNFILDSFVNILDSVDSNILIIDTNYNTRFRNSSAMDGAKVTRESLVGKKCYELNDCNTNQCVLDQCVKNKSKESFEIHEEKTQKSYISKFTPYIDKYGKMRGVIEFALETTELKKEEKIAVKKLEYQKKEVNKFTNKLDMLANGHLDIDASISEFDDDTKEIADNFNILNNSLIESTNSIKSMIDEIAYILSELTNKNFTVGIEKEYVGDFIQLNKSINHIIKEFNTILTEINSAAEQVETGTEQVASSSQSLSQGASQQAGSVEEIGATVTQVAEQTKENAKNANKANELSMKAKLDAQQGNQQMVAMLTSMNEIKESSNNISNIIKVIDEIAFQTNILALNAAVEAARAGEHGKGFAVVAEEVRNLAARSAKAAKETTDLIDNSISKVEDGYKIANNTAEALNKIVDVVTDTGEIVKTIAEESSKQALSISEIDSGIKQVSVVTQTNTAIAEESASASEEMAGQAQMLKGMIQQFKLKDETKTIASHPRIDKKTEVLNKLEKSFEISLDNEYFDKY